MNEELRIGFEGNIISKLEVCSVLVQNPIGKRRALWPRMRWEKRSKQ